MSLFAAGLAARDPVGRPPGANLHRFATAGHAESAGAAGTSAADLFGHRHRDGAAARRRSAARDQIPAPVQTATDADIENSGALDLSDFLNRRLNGVHVNEVQGNPFQPDVNYRGYTASPLLGTPQGLSVYMDGVRLNQPFGDVVSWDLIPRIAISSTHADARLESAVRAEHARRRARHSDEGRLDGAGHDRAGDLRQRRAALGRVRARRPQDERACTGISPGISSARTAGATTRRRTSASCSASWAGSGASATVALAAGFADNSLNGNGLQEQGFLDRDYASVYTKPDITDNRSTFFNVTTRHAITPND